MITCLMSEVIVVPATEAGRNIAVMSDQTIKKSCKGPN